MSSALIFQALSHADFESGQAFLRAFTRVLLREASRTAVLLPEITGRLEAFAAGRIEYANLDLLFACLSDLCAVSEKPVVLMIDEVDNASNHQVFLDFLAQLRRYYINREELPVFHSVILAGVYDIKKAAFVVFYKRMKN